MRKNIKKLINIFQILDISTRIAILGAALMFLCAGAFVTTVTIKEVRAEAALEKADVDVDPCRDAPCECPSFSLTQPET